MTITTISEKLRNHVLEESFSGYLPLEIKDLGIIMYLDPDMKIYQKFSNGEMRKLAVDIFNNSLVVTFEEQPIVIRYDSTISWEFQTVPVWGP